MDHAAAHAAHMRLAIAEARAAFENDGDPVGSVIVADGVVIGAGHNRVRGIGDPTAHAEVEAIRDALRRSGEKLPASSVLYTTEEPCPMCLWMILRCGLAELVIGARYSDLPDEDVGAYCVEAMLSLTGRELIVTDGILTFACRAAHEGRFSDAVE